MSKGIESLFQGPVGDSLQQILNETNRLTQIPNSYVSNFESSFDGLKSFNKYFSYDLPRLSDYSNTWFKQINSQLDFIKNLNIGIPDLGVSRFVSESLLDGVVNDYLKEQQRVLDSLSIDFSGFQDEHIKEINNIIHNSISTLTVPLGGTFFDSDDEYQYLNFDDEVAEQIAAAEQYYNDLLVAEDIEFATSQFSRMVEDYIEERGQPRTLGGLRNLFLHLYRSITSVVTGKVAVFLYKTIFQIILTYLMLPLLNNAFPIPSESLTTEKSNLKQTIKTVSSVWGSRSDIRIVTVETRLNVRAKPNKKSMVIGSLFPYSIVRVIEKQGKWTLVEFVDSRTNQHLEGWVFNKYLERTGCQYNLIPKKR